MTVDQAIAIRVNGEQRRVPGGISIAAMLGEIGLDPKKVAVERNLEIVPRSIYADTPLADGDRIEIVTFIGGG